MIRAINITNDYYGGDADGACAIYVFLCTTSDKFLTTEDGSHTFQMDDITQHEQSVRLLNLLPSTEKKRVFRFHWQDGKVEEREGADVKDAFTRLGYGAGALPALDHYEDLGEVK
jgi:hypothetical protein